MTVTTFLLFLFGITIGACCGIASYIWLQGKKLKQWLKDLEDSMDHHSFTFGNNIDVSVQKSITNEGKHFMCIRGNNAESCMFVDSNSGKILEYDYSED